VGKSKRIGQLRRLIEAAGGEPVFLTPRQAELARKLGYEFEQAPELESPLLVPRTFAPIVDLPPDEPMPRLTAPLTLDGAHAEMSRRRRVMRSGAPMRRSTSVPS
jgi:hypothetical protein